VTRHRIAAAAVAGSVVLLASGCMGMGGGDEGAAGDAAPPSATAPAAVAAPVAVAPATLGGPVRAAANTPKDVAAALKGDDVVVVAFLNGKAADDAKVAQAVRDAQADSVVSDDTQFFVYTLGRKKFGDLADVLGVEGTPSVAVIGRDRNLKNLFTGLIDGDILRQAIWDAADTAAAHIGDPAADATPAKAAAKGPSGSKEGIALAKQVNAAYAAVPAVQVTFAGTGPDGKKWDIAATAVLADGKVTSSTLSGTIGGQKVEIISIGETSYGRPDGQVCWKTRQNEADDASPFVTLAGHRFSDPVTRDGIVALRSVGPDAAGVTMPRTYRIDPATHRVASVTDRDGTVRFTALDAAPSVEVPTPLCEGTVS
jgi:hypothetical protein